MRFIRQLRNNLLNMTFNLFYYNIIYFKSWYEEFLSKETPGIKSNLARHVNSFGLKSPRVPKIIIIYASPTVYKK